MPRPGSLLIEGHPAWHGLGTVTGVVYRGPDAVRISTEAYDAHAAALDLNAVACARGAGLATGGGHLSPRPQFDPDVSVPYSKFPFAPSLCSNCEILLHHSIDAPIFGVPTECVQPRTRATAFFSTGLLALRRQLQTMAPPALAFRAAADPAVFLKPSGAQWLTGLLPVPVDDGDVSVIELDGLTSRPSPAKRSKRSASGAIPKVCMS